MKTINIKYGYILLLSLILYTYFNHHHHHHHQENSGTQTKFHDNMHDEPVSALGNIQHYFVKYFSLTENLCF